MGKYRPIRRRKGQWVKCEAGSAGKSILGNGASCYVQAVQEIAGARQKMAMKVLSKKNASSKVQWEAEYRLLSKVKHDHILEFYEAFQETDYHVLTRLYEGGELFDRVKMGVFTEKVASKLARMMLQALQHCHAVDIVHRDLKPENFVFEEDTLDSKLRLIDFGVALEVKDDTKVRDVAGTMYYIAPEALREAKFLTGATWKKCDVWSFGCIIYLLVCGNVPFAGNSHKQIATRIKAGRYSFPTHALSESVQDLITNCLQPDVSKRFSTQQCLAHPWVQGDTASDVIMNTNVVDGIINWGKQCKLKKAVGKVMRNHMMQASDEEELAALFKQFDKDGNGKLSPDEVKEMMKFIGHDHRGHDLKGFDEDGDGDIDMTELATAVASRNLGRENNSMVDAFKKFDHDGDGFVTAEEIEELCGFMSTEARAELVGEADSDGDGKINFEEWVKAMTSAGGRMTTNIK